MGYNDSWCLWWSEYDYRRVLDLQVFDETKLEELWDDNGTDQDRDAVCCGLSECRHFSRVIFHWSIDISTCIPIQGMAKTQKCPPKSETVSFVMKFHPPWSSMNGWVRVATQQSRGMKSLNVFCEICASVFRWCTIPLFAAQALTAEHQRVVDQVRGTAGASQQMHWLPTVACLYLNSHPHVYQCITM